MNLKNTQTEKNLRAALAGESIARNKYSYFAQLSRKLGNEEIANAFEDMARHEMMHAKFWFDQLFKTPESIEEALRISAKGEHDEWEDMYPMFALQAKEEGFDTISTLFSKVANIERSHEARFNALLAKLLPPETAPVQEAVQEDKPKENFRCQFCGATFVDRPDVCNVCHAIGAFEYIA